MTVPKTSALAATAAVALALLVGACSADSDGAGSTDPTTDGGASSAQNGTPDPCALLTLDEVSEALDVTVTVSQELVTYGQPDQRTCSFTQEVDSTECLTVTECAVTTVTVAVWPFRADQVDGLKAQAGMVTDLDGLGEVAFGGPTAIWAFTGSLMVNVTLFFIEVDSIDPVSSLTRAALDRLR